MKIIQPSFSLGAVDGIAMLRFIEQQARISHRSEDKQTKDSWKRFIQAVVIDHGDWSVTEHVSITATIYTNRGVTHELVRHRLFSFTQESTRFVRYKNELAFIEPLYQKPSQLRYTWETAMADAEGAYFEMLSAGAKPQEARDVLPNSVATMIAATGNLRNWRHFFLMRTSKETHPDFKRTTIPMLAEFQRMVPLLYDDIIPDQRQVENLRKAR